jgi:hypothetical protein
LSSNLAHSDVYCKVIMVSRFKHHLHCRLRNIKALRVHFWKFATCIKNALNKKILNKGIKTTKILSASKNKKAEICGVRFFLTHWQLARPSFYRHSSLVSWGRDSLQQGSHTRAAAGAQWPSATMHDYN